MEIIKPVFLLVSLYSISQAVTVDQFYPFGADRGDTLLTDQQMPLSIYQMRIPFELPLTSTVRVNHFYRIMPDGSISFPDDQFTNIFPLTISTPNFNNVRTTLWVGYSNDTVLLSRAQCDITAQFSSPCGSNFNPKHLLIVTTLNYTDGVQPPGNSFQIVVATDGTQSFAIILFGEVNFAPMSATYTTSITTTGAIRATHWRAPYHNNVTQAPFMMQNSYTPGVYVINILDYNSPQQVTSCEENLRMVVCNALKQSGSVQPQACISTGPVCVP